ncbi:ribosomal subunit 39S-domain-containing protein [Annulohypoxylon truncatum]|uniref:ribosomal subunit 39S-domain-containing protein n=1 Tax=Annulohypoxylon truncatum TaxID=327061 RepID=UPI002007C8C7|nr:ribosomal subunit 39S-domain-containing protein [Annulohypoxylon truncatum]KAI1208632.1 ribosomal subunit 39S-domain-containing protein [Annulohypoxylon truncatum]
MRRITRLRRPSGLSAPVTRSPIAPLVGQSPSVPSHHISASPRKSIPRAGLQCPAFARLYSTDKQPNPQDPSPEAKPTQEASSPEPPVPVPVPEPEQVGHSQYLPPNPAPAPTASSSPSSAAPLAEAAFGPLDKEKAEVEKEPWQTFRPPPRRRTYAERADLVSDRTYAPALRDDGLEVVGNTRGWWDAREHWPASADFVGFRAPARVRENAVLETAVRRAVVEAYALRQGGREGVLVKRWPVGGEEEMRCVLGVKVKVKNDGEVVLDGDVEAVLRALEGEDGWDAAVRPALEVAEAEELRQAWGKDWKAVSLADPRIRFAVTKRIFQLTGHLVQDFQLAGITSVKTLLHVVLKPPKPKTLTMEIQERRQDLVQLPNVTVATKRITRGDKAKAIGRYKLIEEEYKKRDLPLIGHGFVNSNTDAQRIKGDA